MKSNESPVGGPKPKRRRTSVTRSKTSRFRVSSTAVDTESGDVTVFGRGFAGADFMVGGVRLQPLQIFPDRVLLSGKEIRDASGDSLLIRDRLGKAITVELVHHRPRKWFRFSGPGQVLFAPSGIGQPMLVLQVVFHDVTPEWSGPDGAAHLGALLNGPGRCANGFWQEASYGKLSFAFDIDPNIITLPGNMADYLTPIPNSTMSWFDLSRVVEDALTARVQGMSDADAEIFLKAYMGVTISHAVDKNEGNVTKSEGAYWPRADWYEVFTIRGVQYGMAFVHATHGWGASDYYGAWLTFAHEFGHVLGLPDLYPSGKTPDTFEGQEVMQWDIMCNGQGDANPTVWEKACRTTVPTDPGGRPSEPWMNQDEIVFVERPASGQTNSAEALLVPSSLELPSTNPFAASHAGIPLAHSICFRVDPNRNIFVEARQQGPIAATPQFGGTDYDQSIPCDGVIVSEAVDSLDLFPATRRNVTLLSPDYSPPFPSWKQITIGGGTITSWEDTAKHLKVELLEIVQTNPKVFRVKASWGPGPAPNLYIAPWNPPPWESTDIWADDEANGWDRYSHADANLNPSVPGNPVGNGDALAVGSRCRLFARVHNIGDKEALDVQVDFAIVVPPGAGPEIAVGSAVIPAIQPGQAALARVNWTPDSSNGGHVCIRARVALQSGEIVSTDNIAQENLTDWYVRKNSPYQPVEFPFQIHNALPEARLFAVEVLGLRKGYHVDVLPRRCWLEPRETRICRARIVVDDSVPLEDRERRAPLVHLQFKVSTECETCRIGGISGWVHCVRKASSDIAVVPVGRETPAVRGDATREAGRTVGVDHAKPGAEVHARFVTSAGPVVGALVAVRLEGPSGKTVTVERGVTGSDGRVMIWLDAPRGFVPQEDYRAVVMLQPLIGIGPETAVRTFNFTR